MINLISKDNEEINLKKKNLNNHMVKWINMAPFCLWQKLFSNNNFKRTIFICIPQNSERNVMKHKYYSYPEEGNVSVRWSLLGWISLLKDIPIVNGWLSLLVYRKQQCVHETYRSSARVIRLICWIVCSTMGEASGN